MNKIDRHKAAQEILKLKGLRRSSKKELQKVSTENEKDRHRKQIQKDTKKYLKEGGKIKKIKDSRSNAGYKSQEEDKKHSRYVPKTLT